MNQELTNNPFTPLEIPERFSGAVRNVRGLGLNMERLDAEGDE